MMEKIFDKELRLLSIIKEHSRFKGEVDAYFTNSLHACLLLPSIALPDRASFCLIA
jgi:hypothetical protein